MYYQTKIEGWLIDLPQRVQTRSIVFTMLPYVSFYPKSIDADRSPFLRAGTGFGLANFKYDESDPSTACNFTANVEVGFDKYRNGKFWGVRFGYYYFNPGMKYNLPDYISVYENNDFNASNIYFRFCLGPSIFNGGKQK